MMFCVNLIHLTYAQLLLPLALNTRLINVIVSVTLLVAGVLDVNAVDPCMIVSLLS